MDIWENMYPAVVGWNILWMPFRCSWFLIFFKSSFSLLIFSLVLFIIESRVLKYLNTIVELFFSFFSSFSFCCMYFGALFLYAFTFRIVISFWWIGPFVIIKCPLHLATIFVLKCILFDVTIDTLAFFWLLFAWYFFDPLLLTYLYLWVYSVSIVDSM